MDRARLFRCGVYLALIVGVRVQLGRSYPALLTGDSWDFLAAARGIADRLDFGDGPAGLRDCRTPGYPILLALTRPLTRFRSDRLIVMQAAVGLACVGAGWAVGRALRSPRVGEGLMLFLGLNPVYLLHEHALMSEGLSLLVTLALTAAALVGLRDGPGVGRGAAIGGLLGFAALVRVNSVPFGATMAAVVALSWMRSEPLAFRLRSVAAMGLACLLVIAPWAARNHALYGRWSLNMFQNRSLLVYKGMHRSFDPSLPAVRAECAALGEPIVYYEWLWKLTERRGTIGAEEVAGRLLREQWRAHPLGHLRDLAVEVLCFGGLYDAKGNDRVPIRGWFRRQVARDGAADRLYEGGSALAREIGFRYVPAAGGSSWRTAWSEVGFFYLTAFRPALNLAFLVALARWRPRRRSGSRGGAIATVALAYLATVAFHAATLTASDRFSSLYDWAAALVILLVIEDRRSAANRRAAG